MCGIVGVVSNAPVNQLLYDALLLLQHRGQDAAGIVTLLERKFFMHKAKGMVRDVFRTRNMRALPGDVGLGQVRYPTAGNAYSEEEAQPFYVNAPFGIVLVHNGNLTNAHALRAELFSTDHRHTNTESDSEVLLNVLAHEIERCHARRHAQCRRRCSRPCAHVHRRLRGSYAVVALIAGHGLLAFRDPYGIRPLCMGRGADGTVMVASESVALEGSGHVFERNIAPGEAVFIDLQGQVRAEQCAEAPTLHPCIFEFVYLARPDSVLDGISVYQARLNLGETLAQRVIIDRAAERHRRDHPHSRIEPPERHATGAPAGHSVPRGLRQEPLRGPHLHHAGAGRAQEVGAPEAQRDRQRVQGPQRDAGGRFDRARHHQPRDRADGTRGGRAQGLPGQRRAAGALSRTCTASTCRPRTNWSRTTAASKRSASSSVAMR